MADMAGGTAAIPLRSDPARRLSAGRYARPDVAPAIEFEIPERQAGEWAAVQAADGFFDIERGVGTPDVVAVQFAWPIGVADAQAAAASVQVDPGLSIIESSEVEMAGRSGIGMTVDHGGGGDDFRAVFEVVAGPISIGPGRRLWIGWFDVGPVVLAILVGGSVAHWADALTAARPILATVTIGPIPERP